MRRKPVSVVAAVLLGCVSLQAQFEHPDLKSGKKQVHSLLLVPIQVELTRSSMKGDEPMMEESRQTERDLTPVIRNVLQELGYQLDQTSISLAAMEKDSDLRYIVDDLQKRFDAELQQIDRKSKDVRKGRFTLGDEVAKLPGGENSDALLFVRVYGKVVTGGKKFFSAMLEETENDTAQMQFGVVDAKTGEVLYFAKPTVFKNISKQPEKSAGGVKKAFKNLVKASPTGSTAVDTK